MFYGLIVIITIQDESTIVQGQEGITREQLYYNNEHQVVVTSIHYVKIKTRFLRNSLCWNPGQQILVG